MAPRRVCQFGPCQTTLDGAHPRRMFCSDNHRKASRLLRNQAATVTVPRVGPDPGAPVSTLVVDALGAELQTLGVADSYEGRVALGIAAQLDRGTVVGAAYASLSRELDRRVDALRLKAERPDDPVRLITESLTEKQRTHLRSA